MINPYTSINSTLLFTWRSRAACTIHRINLLSYLGVELSRLYDGMNGRFRRAAQRKYAKIAIAFCFDSRKWFFLRVIPLPQAVDFPFRRNGFVILGIGWWVRMRSVMNDMHRKYHIYNEPHFLRILFLAPLSCYIISARTQLLLLCMEWDSLTHTDSWSTTTATTTKNVLFLPPSIPPVHRLWIGLRKMDISYCISYFGVFVARNVSFNGQYLN